MKKRLYYSFFLLIIIPVLIILLGTVYIMNYRIFHAEIERIDLVQENVRSTLQSEISSGSLALSHYLQVNNGTTMTEAEKYSSLDISGKFQLSERLKELFMFISIPKSNYYGVSFFMKDGEFFTVSDDIMAEQEEFRAADWYRAALSEPGQVQIAGAPSYLTYSQRKNKDDIVTLVGAYAPKDEKNSSIEVVVMYLYSEISSMINQYDGKEQMYLLGADNEVLLGRDGEEAYIDYLIRYEAELTDGLYKEKTGIGRSRYYKVLTLPIEGWKIVNVVDKAELMSDFYILSFIVVGIACLVFLFFFAFMNRFLKTIITPIQKLITGMSHVDYEDLEIQVAVSGDKELQELTRSFNKMIEDLREQIRKNEQEEKEKHEAQMRALRAEINPHFIVNTLNSMRFIAMISKFESIQKIAEALIEILSRSFRSSSQFYSVENELSVLNSYIYIMKIRYTENFDVDSEVDDNIRDYLIPHLILQPIVENSIVHGFEDMLENGHILIRAEEDGERLRFTIRDNGRGMTQEEIEHILSDDVIREDEVHIGVSNVNRRIQLIYGEEYGLHMHSVPGEYTETIVILPKKAGEDHV